MEQDLESIGSRTNRTIEEVRHLIAQAKDSMIPLGKQIDVIEKGTLRWFIVTRRGVGLILTDNGPFHQFDFSVDDAWEKYSIIFRGALDEHLMPVFKKPDLLLIRVDSGCETGQVFGDRTCECREQLVLGMKTLADEGEGMIVNIPHQDGRGLGLPFKLATLRLQTLLKLDTVEAAHAITPNGVIDVRTYGGVIGILKYFGVSSVTKINLATNNRDKAAVFSENGFTVSDFTPVVIPPTEHTSIHLNAKQQHLGHIGLMPNQGKQERSERDETSPDASQGSNDSK